MTPRDAAALRAAIPPTGICLASPTVIGPCSPLLWDAIERFRLVFVGGICVLNVDDAGLVAHVLIVPPEDPPGDSPSADFGRVRTPTVMKIDAARLPASGHC